MRWHSDPLHGDHGRGAGRPPAVCSVCRRSGCPCGRSPPPTAQRGHVNGVDGFRTRGHLAHPPCVRATTARTLITTVYPR